MTTISYDGKILAAPTMEDRLHVLLYAALHLLTKTVDVEAANLMLDPHQHSVKFGKKDLLEIQTLVNDWIRRKEYKLREDAKIKALKPQRIADAIALLNMSFKG